MSCPGDSKWSLGKVIEVMGLRSYLVEVNGRRYRRNRKNLPTTAEQLPVQTELSDTEESLTDETIEEQAEVDAWEAREVVKMEVYGVRGEAVALQNVWKITSATDTEHTVCIAKIVIIRIGSVYSIKHLTLSFLSS